MKFHCFFCHYYYWYFCFLYLWEKYIALFHSGTGTMTKKTRAYIQIFSFCIFVKHIIRYSSPKSVAYFIEHLQNLLTHRKINATSPFYYYKPNRLETKNENKWNVFVIKKNYTIFFCSQTNGLKFWCNYCKIKRKKTHEKLNKTNGFLVTTTNMADWYLIFCLIFYQYNDLFILS